MIADVWGKGDVVVAVVVLVAVALVGLGQWLDVRLLTITGGIVAVVGMAVFIARRVIGSRDDRHRGDRWV